MSINNDLRYRGRANQPETKQSVDKHTLKKDNLEKLFGLGHIVLICIIISTLCCTVHLTEEYLPEAKPVDTSPPDFSAVRARVHLEKITSIGPRTAGSYANDIQTVNYLLKELNFVKDNAESHFNIEIELQKASGSFAFFRKATKVMESVGMTSTYDDTSNVIVKISSSKDTKKFVLVNAHFDTVSNTEGASDDTVNCAILIETFRALTKLDSTQLKHGVIFLFNGAEEGGLSGSHAFLQHRWFPLVNVVVNVEAAGSGGREFVFQTGPNHPWILGMYASTAKYPSATVLAQEIFHSGIIPSDTDFRVFVQYGKLVGVDMAFVKNGYVYHTRYDDAKSIPSGSIQRAGDNIHALVKGIANSEYLENPDKYKHGSSVFFDVLGLFMIHYPKRLHLLMNWITCAAVAMYIVQKLVKRRYASQREHTNLSDLLKSDISFASLLLAVLAILFSWVLAIIVPVLVALLLTKLNVLMTWYSCPKFTLLLYGLPSLFGLLLGHFIANKLIKKVAFISIQSFVCGHLVIHSLLLFVANLHDISSSFIIWFWIIFPFVFLCLVLDKMATSENKASTTYLLHLAAFIPPGLLSMSIFDLLYLFFGPLLGRMGDKVNSEVVIAVLSALSIVVVFTYLMNLYHGVVDMKRLMFIVGLLSILPLVYVMTGRLQPYSGKNPITPKRIYMEHIVRRFHNSDGSLEKNDSGIWIQPVDHLGYQPLQKLDFFKGAEDLPCEGSYCGLPYYYAKRVMLNKQWYLRGEQPEGIMDDVLTTDIYKREVQADGSIKFNFDIKGSDHMVLFLTLKEGVTLDWSMYKTEDGHIYRMRDYHGGYTHVVFYTHGYQHESWTFWMQFKRNTTSTSSALAQLGIAQHHLHGPKARTRFLRAAINELPDWIHDNSWCSNYDSFMLA